MSKVLDLKIEGMTCAHCEVSITKELQKLAGAEGITVSAATGTAHLTVDETVEEAEITAAIEEAGYQLISN